MGGSGELLIVLEHSFATSVEGIGCNSDCKDDDVDDEGVGT